MFALDFARPEKSLKLKMAWDMLHKLNFGVFGQLVIIPLLQKHRILAQVAGYHTEVIKFLPPITITRQDVDWFVTAMDDVLADTQRFPGAAWDLVSGLAKRTVTALLDPCGQHRLAVLRPRDPTDPHSRHTRSKSWTPPRCSPPSTSTAPASSARWT